LLGTGVCHDSRKGMCPIQDGVVRFIATGGYIGYCPIAPGTCGSLLGVGVFLLLATLPPVAYGCILMGVLGLGVWTAGEAEKMLGSKDASAHSPNSNGYPGDGESCWMTSALAYWPTVVFVSSCLLYKLYAWIP
jgi:hypothetical protein